MMDMWILNSHELESKIWIWKTLLKKPLACFNSPLDLKRETIFPNIFFCPFTFPIFHFQNGFLQYFCNSVSPWQKENSNIRNSKLNLFTAIFWRIEPMCLDGLCYFERHHFYENREKKGQGGNIERQVELNENENLTAYLHHTYLNYRIIYHIPQLLNV